jgi:hypothetical protein
LNEKSKTGPAEGSYGRRDEIKGSKKSKKTYER